MAKGRPTGSSAAAGASMTKAPGAAAATAGTPAVAGHWSKPANMEAGITQQWVAPQAAVPAVPAAAPAPRDRFAEMLRGDNWANGGSRSSDAGYTTSGRGWSGNSSANSGYGMGGRNW